MVATATTGATGSYPGANSTGGPAAGGTVPFFYGSNIYVEKFATDNWTMGASSQEFVQNINPGGFLRGVRLQVRSSGGSGGTVATADNPWNVFSSISLENIDGSPIQYPMSGYAYKTANKFFRPWMGDPAKRFDYAPGINPSFSLFIQPEIRHTAGVLANTDARALYRIRLTVNTVAQIFAGAPTGPALTITYYMESWAQPDSTDLQGSMIEPVPAGLNVTTLRRHQVFQLNSAGADNIFQLSNTGNELRGMIFIVRDSNNARQDYLSDPIRWRLDARSMGTFAPDEVFNQMADFYEMLNSGASSRDSGVYVFPRFYQPGTMTGQSWLQTTNATYLIFESTTPTTATNVPGTVEVITDEAIPVGSVPIELEAC